MTCFVYNDDVVYDVVVVVFDDDDDDDDVVVDDDDNDDVSLRLKGKLLLLLTTMIMIGLVYCVKCVTIYGQAFTATKLQKRIWRIYTVVMNSAEYVSNV